MSHIDNLLIDQQDQVYAAMDADPTLCSICHRQQPDQPPVCDRCRDAGATLLDSIRDLLPALGSAVIPITGAARERVSASPEPTIPLNPDAVDLDAPERPLWLSEAGKRWMRDQIGHTSARALLFEWAQEWHPRLNDGTMTPAHGSTTWLAARWEWACDHHPAIDVFVTEMTDLERTLRGVTGIQPDDTHKVGNCPGSRNEPCGAELRVTPWQDTAECRRCTRRWSRADWPKLATLMAANKQAARS